MRRTSGHPSPALALGRACSRPRGRRRSSRRPGPEPVLVAMGTASITGVYFPVGVALCPTRQPTPARHRRPLRRPPDRRLGWGSSPGCATASLGLAIVQSDTQAQAVAGSGGLRRGRPVRRACAR